MTFAIMKEKLLDYIEHADEKKIMALYTLLEHDIDKLESADNDEKLDMRSQ